MCDDEKYVLDHPQDCRSTRLPPFYACRAAMAAVCVCGPSSEGLALGIHVVVRCIAWVGYGCVWCVVRFSRCLVECKWRGPALPCVAAGGVSQLAVVVEVVGEFTRKPGSNPSKVSLCKESCCGMRRSAGERDGCVVRFVVLAGCWGCRPAGLQGRAVLVTGRRVGSLLAHRWVAAEGVTQLAVGNQGEGGRGRVW